MRILPDLELVNDSFTKSQTGWIVFTVYFNFVMVLLLLAFCLYNVEMYLRRQGKWRVFPLAMFYALSLFMILCRTEITIMTVRSA